MITRQRRAFPSKSESGTVGGRSHKQVLASINIRSSPLLCAGPFASTAVIAQHLRIHSSSRPLALSGCTVPAANHGPINSAASPIAQDSRIAMPSRSVRQAEKRALEGANESQDTLVVAHNLMLNYGVGLVSRLMSLWRRQPLAPSRLPQHKPMRKLTTQALCREAVHPPEFVSSPRCSELHLRSAPDAYHVAFTSAGESADEVSYPHGLGRIQCATPVLPPAHGLH